MDSFSQPTKPRASKDFVSLNIIFLLWVSCSSYSLDVTCLLNVHVLKAWFLVCGWPEAVLERGSQVVGVYL